MKKNKTPQEILQESYEIWRIGNAAVKEAQEQNRKMGIPNVYSFNGKIYHEDKNGDIVKGSPFEG